MPPATPPILIHVPKSGGTTLVMAVSGGRRPPRVGDGYRHAYWNVDRTRMHSNAGDVFTEAGAEKYRDRVKILTVRRPIDRLESEFGFLGNREEFRRLWTSMSGGTYPGTFHDFVRHPNAADATTKFLLGRDLYDPEPVTEGDLDRILARLDDENFVFGSTEDMPATMRNLEAALDIRFGDTVTRYRTSLHKPERGSDWPAVEDAFREGNPNDLRLHAEITRRFEAQISALPPGEGPSFAGGRYDSIFQFLTGGDHRTPFEIFVNDLDDPARCYAWIRERRDVLATMQTEAIRTSSGDPRNFVAIWLRSVARAFPELGLESSAIDASDPLKTVRDVCLRMFA